MKKSLLAVASIMTSLTIGISPVGAESWQEWSQSNPTYPSSPSASPNNTITSPPAQPSFSQPQPSPVPPAKQATPNNGSTSLSTKNPIFEQQFLQGCQRDSLPLSYCQCALKEVQNNFTFDEVMSIAKFMQDNREIPTELMNVAMKCLLG